MECEVIVVGAGMGGLTTAALLAARGVDVCVFERQPEVGGCVANFEHLGYTFEPTWGLYSGWEAGGTWERIFSQLPVTAPGVKKLTPNYVVRLPDGHDFQVSSDHSALETEIASRFTDCADAAIRFLREVRSGAGSAVALAELLEGTSREFRWFIDAQLQTFAQCTSNNCSLSRASAALQFATGDLWSIEGGAQTLVERLAESLKASGGSLRLNSPVLRLAYGTDGKPAGVDLLSGERVIAKRAIISNLTIWDTYGKLVGPSRTPREVASELKKLTAWGAYLIFLAIDEGAIKKLPSPRTLLVCDSDVDEYDPESQQLMMNLASEVTAAPAGKRALRAIAFTQADEWFSFHEDHSWHEEKDQALLESWWTKLHQALPQLGDSIEVIETSTPQTVYETTRRRLGMIGSPSAIDRRATVVPPFPNLFLAGDTVSAGLGLEGVANSALDLADHLAQR